MKASETPCVICNSLPTDRCHIKSRGAGGTWDDWNILAMCRAHHQQQGRLGFSRMCVKHPHLAKILDDKGWGFVEQFGIRKLVRK